LHIISPSAERGDTAAGHCAHRSKINGHCAHFFQKGEKVGTVTVYSDPGCLIFTPTFLGPAPYGQSVWLHPFPESEKRGHSDNFLKGKQGAQ